jgi:hypothetical protein
MKLPFPVTSAELIESNANKFNTNKTNAYELTFKKELNYNHNNFLSPKH